MEKKTQHLSTNERFHAGEDQHLGEVPPRESDADGSVGDRPLQNVHDSAQRHERKSLHGRGAEWLKPLVSTFKSPEFVACFCASSVCVQPPRVVEWDVCNFRKMLRKCTFHS